MRARARARTYAIRPCKNQRAQIFQKIFTGHIHGKKKSKSARVKNINEHTFGKKRKSKSTPIEKKSKGTPVKKNKNPRAHIKKN